MFSSILWNVCILSSIINKALNESLMSPIFKWLNGAVGSH